MFDNGFSNYIANEKRYSAHTLRAYESDLQQFFDFAQNADENFNPLAGDHTVIREWIVFLLENGDKPRSVNRKITTLHTYYKYLMREGLVSELPTKKIIKPKTEKNLPYFVDSKAMQQLFDYLQFPDSFEGVRDRTIMLTFYCTGIRLAELCGIKLNDIDFYNSQLKVLGKRNKERIIPFGIELQASLKTYIKERGKIAGDNEFLFVTSKGEPVYSKLVYRLVNKYLGAVTTLDKKSPHVLRHTFATHMLNNGAEITAIKELLGHANLAATQIYTHTTFEKLKEIYNQAHPRA
ncbi:MAG: tyrosine-type recombinase/integrase [Salinivirgaceae bacterium]|nr:tyrosine-type recombinase/integrase [Salinivirgaceae bacterium]